MLFLMRIWLTSVLGWPTLALFLWAAVTIPTDYSVYCLLLAALRSDLDLATGLEL